MEGPLQGGLGIIKGTAGIVGITAASGLGSLGKMTNSINKGIIAVSLDRNYIHKRKSKISNTNQQAHLMDLVKE